jgi:hypothetical protein
MSAEATTLSTRRGVLTGAAAGLVAVIAHAVGRPLPARAVDGETITVGAFLAGTSGTYLQITASTGQAGFGGEQLGSGPGLAGYGHPGVRGKGTLGVKGYDGSAPLTILDPVNTGV